MLAPDRGDARKIVIRYFLQVAQPESLFTPCFTCFHATVLSYIFKCSHMQFVFSICCVVAYMSCCVISSCWFLLHRWRWEKQDVSSIFEWVFYSVSNLWSSYPNILMMVYQKSSMQIYETTNAHHCSSITTWILKYLNWLISSSPSLYSRIIISTQSLISEWFVFQWDRPREALRSAGARRSPRGQGRL